MKHEDYEEILAKQMEKKRHLALSLGQKRKAHFLDNKVTTLETTLETVSDNLYIVYKSLLPVIDHFKM